MKDEVYNYLLKFNANIRNLNITNIIIIHKINMIKEKRNVLLNIWKSVTKEKQGAL